MNKKEIRKNILLSRNAISKTDINIKSEIIEEKVIKWLLLHKIDRLYLYASYGSEVMTGKIAQFCIDNNIKIAFPKITDEKRSMMEFYEVKRLDADFVMGYMGIAEPEISDERLGECFKPQAIVIPGVAFDRSGNRIGYGKGFYDRFLSTIDTKFVDLIGLAFEMQLVNDTDADANDIKVNWIITENENIRIENK